MKKFTIAQLAAILIAALLILMPFTALASNTDTITVLVNGEEVYFPD